MRELLPIGEYYYDKDEKSFDEAWAQLNECCQKQESIICRVTECSEDNKSIELDYYGIKGIIKDGYITENRLLHNEDFVGKTICVYIHHLNDRNKTFVGTRLRVEQEAKRQLSSLRYGDMVEGILRSFGNDESFAFIDIKEGIQVYLSMKKVTRVPAACCKLSDYLQVGDHVKGRVIYIEPQKTPRHDTYCVISLLDLEKDWKEEAACLEIGSIVSGHPIQDILRAQKYYIEYTRNVCIEMDSEEKLDKAQLVSVRITGIDCDKKKIYAELEGKKETDQEHEQEAEPDISEEEEAQQENNSEEKSDAENENQLSLFRMQIKAEVSPFSMRAGEAKDFDSTPNRYVSMRLIRQRIAQGQLKEEHFCALEAVDRLMYCTSKQILSYLYCEKKGLDIRSQDKLNTKLDSLAKLAMVDRFNFYSQTGTGIYRVYFLNKNGHLVLQSYLHKKRTSYEPGLIAKTPEEIKRRLAANQVILAYKETFDFIQDFHNYKVVVADVDVPIRPTAIIQFVNSTLLIEVRRRFGGWEEDLHNKMERYQILFQNHEAQKLPYNAPAYLKMPLYLLVVCEDLEHADEVRNTLFGHAMYPRIFFTYDILVFHRKVNSSIFRFEGTEQDVVYYNLTELFHYNLEHPEERQTQDEEEDGYVVDKFYGIMQKSYMAGLSYLQKHNCTELQKFVQSNLRELYSIVGDEYQAVYPEDKQYFVYLLYLINQDLITNPTPSFYEGERTQEADFGKMDDLLSESVQAASEEKAMPSALEQAVSLVVSEIEAWMENYDWAELGMNGPVTIKKRSMVQTSGVQFGYDVGLDFTYGNEAYYLGFECKSHQGRDSESDNEKKTRLTINNYAYNLLQYYMYCKRGEGVHNYWILICPFRDLQNDFYKNLFEKWNQENPFMQLRVFSFSQTEIRCEDFLALNEDAYRMVYKHNPPVRTHQERQEFMKQLFLSIVEVDRMQASMPSQLSQYPFRDEYSACQEIMPLKTVDGEDVLEMVLRRLGEGTNVFLIGEYGSGKTHMTYRIVKTILEHSDQYAFHPLWFKLIESSIDLKNENMQASAEKFIEEGLSKHSGLSGNPNYGGRNKILVILDGLDEIIFGLEESVRKIQFLREVYKQFRRRFRNNVMFVITSREKDFKSCCNSRDFGTAFDSFARIVIGDCAEEDAIEKLSAVRRSMGDVENSHSILETLAQNSNLAYIARKPLYFGFLRELIIDRDISDCRDELDILEKIIHASIQYYLKQEDSSQDWTENEVMEVLRKCARDISEQLGRGEGDEITLWRRLLPREYEKNVIQLRRKNRDEYTVRFYHNAIREYLVAESLYREMGMYLADKSGNEKEVLSGWLQNLDMTPETIDFFCKFADRDPMKKQQIVMLLFDMLKAVKSPELSGLGTHIISLLFRMQPEIENQDLSGIYANNVFLWNCSLRNVNLQNTHMNNLSLFNVVLDGVDLRGADLKGILMGTEENVLDAKHFIRNEKMTITVLYSSGQLIDYVFPDYHDLGVYSIVRRAQLRGSEYQNMCFLQDDVLFYSKNKVTFLSDVEKTFEMTAGHQLIYIDKRSALILKEGLPHLVLHDQHYQQRHIRRLPDGEHRNIFVIDSNTFLYVRDRKLFIQSEDKSYFVTDLNLRFECFTVLKRVREECIVIFVKYSDDIQIIRYDLKNRQKQYDSVKLSQYCPYRKLVAISETLLYGISEQTVYLHDLSNPGFLGKLEIQVKCKDLVLENEDGTGRVQGDTEYQMLKKIVTNRRTGGMNEELNTRDRK